MNIDTVSHLTKGLTNHKCRKKFHKNVCTWTDTDLLVTEDIQEQFSRCSQNSECFAVMQTKYLDAW